MRRISVRERFLRVGKVENAFYALGALENAFFALWEIIKEIA